MILPLETVATEVLLLLHTTVGLSVWLAGTKETFTVVLSPGLSFTLALSRAIPVVGILDEVTVTVTVPEYSLPSEVTVAVITAVSEEPSGTVLAVTRPVELTVATEVLELL